MNDTLICFGVFILGIVIGYFLRVAVEEVDRKKIVKEYKEEKNKIKIEVDWIWN